MSKYESEHGILKLPTKAWKPFRDGLAKAYNERQEKRYELAKEIHAHLLRIKATTKRGQFKPKEALDNLIYTTSSYSSRASELGFNEYKLAGMVLSDDHTTLRAPLKKDNPTAVATKKMSYGADMGSIHLNPATYQVIWRVNENNHAVESSWDSWMGKAFANLLSKISWTRATGGKFVGNDEYNRDSEDEEGGGNYVTARYGPLGKEEERVRRRRIVRKLKP